MPCYRCGTRQVDPEAGKSSPWRRGVVREHQVLICPACQPFALADLSRCLGCGSAHLIRRLDQVECLDCRLTRDAEPEPAPPAQPAALLAAGQPAASPSAADPSAADPIAAVGAPSAGDPAAAAGQAPAAEPPGSAAPAGDLAAEVAQALERLLRDR